MRSRSAAIVAALGGLLLTACTTTLSDAPARRAAPSSVDDLTAMLLSVEEIGRIVGVDLEVSETYEKFLDYAEFTPERCAGVPFNTIERAYRGSRFTGVSGMVMDDASYEHWVDEGVVRYATAADAHRYVAQAEAIWRDCAGVEATEVPRADDERQTWSIGQTERLGEPGGLQVRMHRVAGPYEVCAHAMADHANHVIDVVVCGPTVADEAATILNRIANRPPV